MKYKLFSNSGESVSQLGFGAMGLGGSFGAHDESYLIRSILHCLDKGVNFIDTARGYGVSERIVGKALKEWNGTRPFVASKAASRSSSIGWGTSIPVEDAYPVGSIRASVEESLKQMDIETIDLMQMHQFWPQWDDVDYWMEDLLRLQEEGKIRFIGISLPDHRHDMAISLVRSGKIASVQTILNIFDPIALDNLVPICQKEGVAVIARCILDEGGLTGFLQKDTTFKDKDFRKSFFESVNREDYLNRVNRLNKFVPQYAPSLAQLAIKFAIHHPGVTTALTSMNIIEYADENIAAIEQESLPEDIFLELARKHRWIRNLYEAYYW
ncbi:aldo/keto reductase [Paenibacillus sp. BC26]|uniref:aldo/keto reductase n=1 Tax=Paenibacillus sp. BC26 TaxID=1881032 RepID=UPI0008DF1C87|nr:aldo/keto reductase [Paenibacillus sp. BC26]SFS73749.1 Predicted oxidoreductase [Paenibacillus sp. BC26]